MKMKDKIIQLTANYIKGQKQRAETKPGTDAMRNLTKAQSDRQRMIKKLTTKQRPKCN